MPQFVLIGLCEPLADDQRAEFEEWFVDEHIEDTTHCPNFVRGRVFRLAGGHLGSGSPSEYLSLYEIEADSYEEAERVLNDWQRDPHAWEGRAKHQQTRERIGTLPMVIKGSGWYRLLGDHTGPGPAKPGTG